mmetsp:Transcript_4189/g.9791  ORF Transcript_4189/g.9791 Transcript_4189/m.9791 type:complete len:216 (-) Transcript_4189:1231-1878(-)
MSSNGRDFDDIVSIGRKRRRQISDTSIFSTASEARGENGNAMLEKSSRYASANESCPFCSICEYSSEVGNWKYLSASTGTKCNGMVCCSEALITSKNVDEKAESSSKPRVSTTSNREQRPELVNSCAPCKVWIATCNDSCSIIWRISQVDSTSLFAIAPRMQVSAWDVLSSESASAAKRRRGKWHRPTSSCTAEFLAFRSAERQTWILGSSRSCE